MTDFDTTGGYITLSLADLEALHLNASQRCYIAILRKYQQTKGTVIMTAGDAQVQLNAVPGRRYYIGYDRACVALRRFKAKLKGKYG